jgi:hypothetical protein
MERRTRKNEEGRGNGGEMRRELKCRKELEKMKYEKGIGDLLRTGQNRRG